MKRQKTAAISKNLTYSLVLTVVAASAMIISFNFYNASHNAKIELERSAQGSIEYLTDILERPMWNLDHESIRQVGLALSQNKLIVRLKISDTRGNILFNLEKKNNGALIKKRGSVVHGGEYLGSVDISLTAQYYKEGNLRLLRSNIIMTIIIMLALTLMTGVLLRYFLEKPLQLLGKIADSYASGSYEALDTHIVVKEFWPFVSTLKQMGKKLNTQMLELKKSEMRYRSLIEQAADAVFVLNSEGKLLDVNQKACDSLGYSRRGLLDLSISTISPDFPAEKFARFMEDIRCDTPVTVEGIHQRKDRGTFPVELNIGLIDQEGRRLVLAIARDITERKRNEETIRQYSENLEQKVKERTKELEDKTISLEKSQDALVYLLEDINDTKAELVTVNEKLKELDRLKSMFIASMSHELRTPLNSIIGFTGIILQGMSGDINDEQEDQLQRVYGAAKHLLALITDVIDISKIEAGRVEIYAEKFSLEKVVEEAVTNIMPKLKSKGLELEVALPDGLQLYTDYRRLLQCVLNYLSNAVRYTEKGKISLSASGVDGFLEVRVVDSGIGIKDEDIPRLFNSFVRLDSHLKTTVPGTGLGLYLTRKIVNEMLGGKVAAESKYGKGSTFIFSIPLIYGQEGEKQ